MLLDLPCRHELGIEAAHHGRAVAVEDALRDDAQRAEPDRLGRGLRPEQRPDDVRHLLVVGAHAPRHEPVEHGCEGRSARGPGGAPSRSACGSRAAGRGTRPRGCAGAPRGLRRPRRLGSRARGRRARRTRRRPHTAPPCRRSGSARRRCWPPRACRCAAMVALRKPSSANTSTAASSRRALVSAERAACPIVK